MNTKQGNHPDDKPYHAPDSPPPATGEFDASGDNLYHVARCQRGVILCILVYFFAMIGQVMLPAELQVLMDVGLLVVSIVAAVYVFLLAIKLFGTSLGIVLGILTLVPLLGLIVLLVVNGKATRLLKNYGVKVGLLGANPAEI